MSAIELVLPHTIDDSFHEPRQSTYVAYTLRFKTDHKDSFIRGWKLGHCHSRCRYVV